MQIYTWFAKRIYVFIFSQRRLALRGFNFFNNNVVYIIFLQCLKN
jgi:hypothetical protein